MTEHDLKEMKNLGAELGAAKAENEGLRGLLERIATIAEEREHGYATRQHGWIVNGRCANKLVAMLPDIHATLSPQAEPTDTYTAVDMATAAAQGFRDGQAAVEQAPAQDEREAFKRALHSQKVFKLSSATMSAAEWAWFARPAQAEQQPVGYQFQDREGVWKQFMSEKHYEDTLADGTWPIRAIYAAHITQTAPLKPHQLRELVNDLRDVARKYHATEQLREQIANTLRAALSAQGQSNGDS